MKTLSIIIIASILMTIGYLALNKGIESINQYKAKQLTYLNY